VEDLIGTYFIRPILERTGYNAINTAVYAIIAIACLYLLWKVMKKKGFDFASKEFLFAVGAFVLLGSTSRVVTDLQDAGTLAMASAQPGAMGQVYALADSVFAYGYLTVTPGIYIITALLLLISLAIGKAMKNGWFAPTAGIILWLPCMLLIVPFIAHLDFFLLSVALAGVGSLCAFFALERLFKLKLGLHQKLAISGQAMDGAATFVVLNIFAPTVGKSYFEQHILSAGIGTATPLGFFLFFLVKLALSSAIVYYISKEKIGKGDMALVLLVVAIMGFAPGIRDALRMLAGT
jgi:uncharacterized membrane protein